MGLILRLRLFVSVGLFMTSWETFMNCDCVKGGKEYLRLDECGLRMMSGVQTKSFREGSCPPVGWGVYVFIMEF